MWANPGLFFKNGSDFYYFPLTFLELYEKQGPSLDPLNVMGILSMISVGCRSNPKDAPKDEFLERGWRNFRAPYLLFSFKPIPVLQARSCPAVIPLLAAHWIVP